MTTSARIAIFAALLLAAFWSGWIVKGWREDSKELSRLDSALITAWTLQSDLNGALANLAKARAEQIKQDNKVDKAYAEYLKNPDRNADCSKFSDSRVRTKAAAVDAANSVSRPKG